MPPPRTQPSREPATGRVPPPRTRPSRAPGRAGLHRLKFSHAVGVCQAGPASPRNLGRLVPARSDPAEPTFPGWVSAGSGQVRSGQGGGSATAARQARALGPRQCGKARGQEEHQPPRPGLRGGRLEAGDPAGFPSVLPAHWLTIHPPLCRVPPHAGPGVLQAKPLGLRPRSQAHREAPRSVRQRAVPRNRALAGLRHPEEPQRASWRRWQR